MSRPSRSALAGLLALALSTGAAEAQQIEDAYGWYLGGQGGVTIFETPAQTQASIPTVGGHVLVMVQKFGLLASYERAFEDGQLTSFADPTVLGGRRGVTFNAINKVTTAAVAYPFRGAVEPFIGGGLGIYVVSGLEVDGPFANEEARQDAEERAEDYGSRAFVTGLGGVQVRFGRVAVYGQYQIISNGGDETLFEGPLQTISGGLRIRLGSTRSGRH